MTLELVLLLVFAFASLCFFGAVFWAAWRKIGQMLAGLVLAALLSGCSVPAPGIYPGFLGLSPGINALQRPNTWTGHSLGASDIVADLHNGVPAPKTLVFLDPWPPEIWVPAGPEVVVHIHARPSVVHVAEGTRLIDVPVAKFCPFNHVFAPLWPEAHRVHQ